jgi:hypothetical protein
MSSFSSSAALDILAPLSADGLDQPQCRQTVELWHVDVHQNHFGVQRAFGRVEQPADSGIQTLLRHDDPQKQVDQKPGATQQDKEHERQAHPGRTDVEALGETAAYAGDHSIGFAAIQTLPLHGNPPASVRLAHPSAALRTHLRHRPAAN